MKQESTTALRRRRKRLAKGLPPLEAILRGSLIERHQSCGKPGCKCQRKDHPGHGPKHYLSVSRSGARPEMDYVPQEYAEQAQAYLDNFKCIREILKEICDINRELLRRRTRL